MQRGLCGKILSRDLGFLIPSSRTIGFNLIVKLSEDIDASWVIRIGIQFQLIHGGMDKLRLSIRS